ncbi:helix-turn-helix transcriptional regulator [Halomarina pelagica]|uniref:helix-turn-helix transcriptional regulator n=1 Tax=Halomarina pelagica TaxID=2961599 RepID=UPI0020C43510|nr:helix-turn-helix transcriptional regulator [Halomarina sp. BND7]
MTLLELTGLQRDPLRVIAGFDRPSGQQTKSELETEMGREITHGRLYPNLDTLVNRGYVEKGQLDRRTNWYALSGQDREALSARHEWEDDYLPFEIPTPW